MVHFVSIYLALGSDPFAFACRVIGRARLPRLTQIGFVHLGSPVCFSCFRPSVFFILHCLYLTRLVPAVVLGALGLPSHSAFPFGHVLSRLAEALSALLRHLDTYVAYRF
jgi:hypothetical protein